MACWQRNWQLTQPPAAARRRRVDMKIAKTSAAATAAPTAATVTAVATAAVLKKWLTRTAKTSHATNTIAAADSQGGHNRPWSASLRVRAVEGWPASLPSSSWIAQLSRKVKTQCRPDVSAA